MRCPQCGTEGVLGAAFCSRCGTRLMMPRPEQRREFALTTIFPSWWRFLSALTVSTAAVIAGLYTCAARSEHWRAGLVAIGLGFALLGLTALARRGLNWSLTSERLIERRGIFSISRRELELADIRSVEVDRRLMQRLLGLGNVTVASAASADFLIRLLDIPNPEAIAEQLRQARLKRIA